PMLWILSGVTLLVIVALVRGALRRGRDSFYPALGAGSVIALLIASFANDGVFTPAVSIVAAAIVGLGFAQSSGRTPRQPELLSSGFRASPTAIPRKPRAD